MRGTVHVVALPPAAAGFRLAGLAVDAHESASSGAARATALAARSDIGVLLVEQPCLDALPEAERLALLDRPAPIVVPFPSPAPAARGAPADAVVLEILRRAIGYRVRLG